MPLDTSTDVGKIRRFGSYAQVACVALFGIFAISGPVTVLFMPRGPNWTGFASVYFAVLGVVAFTIGLVAIGYLYALFGALAKGEIYSMANVRRIRRLGELALVFGALRIVVPVVSFALLNAGIFPPSAVSFVPIGIPSDSLSLLITGGLILLVSWIMEVGRRTTEDADRMRREAELVV